MEYSRLSEINIRDYIGKRIYAVFMCKDIEIKTQKDGKTEYMNISIQDKNIVETGVKIFEIKEYHRTMILEGYVYRAAIDVQKYEQSKNGYSLVIYNISMINDDSRDYFDWCEGIDTASEYIRNRVANIKDRTYHMITELIVMSNWDKFVMYPAANSIHHSQLGGLCMHTYEVMRYAESISNTYNEMQSGIEVNIDLVVAASAIHDIGKLKEFTVNMKSGKSDYSVESALLTHIITGIEVLCAAEMKLATEIEDWSDEDTHKIKLLKHCILSHHGKLEYGSPIEPSIIEAYIISKADHISADIYRFNKAYNDMDSNSSKTIWSSGKIEKYYKS